MDSVYEELYEVWSTKDGHHWEYEAGSGTFEGAAQFAEYVETGPSVKRVRVWKGEVIAYDSYEDKGRTSWILTKDS